MHDFIIEFLRVKEIKQKCLKIKLEIALPQLYSYE